MATYRQIVYEVLDEIKSVNGDSYITEEHVMFLANLYRLLIIQLKLEKKGASSISSSEEQTICLDLEETNSLPDMPCAGELYLKSIQEIPATISGTNSSIYPYNYFNVMFSFVTKDRMKYVGYNKYLQNIIYCCIQDNHLYLKSANPQFLYLDKIKFTGVFEDAEKATELSCDEGEGEECKDVLDKEFPLAGDSVPVMIDLLVKQLYQALNRPADEVNDDKDNIADIISYIRRNMKSNIAKQLEE